MNKMKNNFFIIIILILFFPVVGMSNNKLAQNDEDLNELEIIKLNDSTIISIVEKDGSKKEILLDRKKILLKGQYFTFKCYFSMEDRYVILVEEESGRSGCPLDYYFIT